jgi:uncharacterized membrane protein YdfJ with MMPL/SSD domain
MRHSIHRAARASARRPKAVIALWLLLVIGCATAGAMTGTRQLTDAESGVGESGRADRIYDDAGLQRPAVESVLVRSGEPGATRAAAAALAERARDLAEVEDVRADLTAEGGRAVLVEVTLRGDPDTAGERVAPLERAVAATAASHPAATLQQAGAATLENAFDGIVEEDLERAELISLPIILVVLVVTFGALVAASVPLILGITSVAAALGAAGVVSQLVPDSGTTASLIVLIGLAVGVDYSLFYIRREREERRAGRGPDAALAATAATVGRAVVVSGLTVIVALAGLLVTGIPVFASMAVGTMVVVAIAVIGSVTVLPAVLALLGDRIDRGRVPLPGRRRGGGAWGRLAAAVTRRPAAALIVSVCLLGTLAAPAFDMRTGETQASDLPADVPAVAALQAIERTFPGAPASARLVVTGSDLDTAGLRLEALGERAREVTGGRGEIDVTVAGDGRTAAVDVPMPDRGPDQAERVVDTLRERVAPSEPGMEVLVTGQAAASLDFTAKLEAAMPVVIGFVLTLAFVLLVASFRSPALAAATMALNLLSVGATYGILAMSFDTVVNWVPLFTFVILFGLSMDYTVLILERIREARAAGRTAREAAAVGVGATAGAVTSAAVVMVAVFSLFATARLPDMNQMGVGLTVAVLLDATLVRGVALPAAVALLGDRRWRPALVVPASARSSDGR